ncbi:S66 peptidase family protein [Planomicrobium sp. Y74]|uniref:S66 family peptidase n=1 Tax=Planomicrobium sp. Y74 TaxID=2478977 RepID=UPI000EF4C4AC|nr:S66 peptidase family protein [Planomicrobium sp. Y74]RLQ92516.1 LD-carboxypeptidase [Planomicrobium sp. Y74]
MIRYPPAEIRNIGVTAPSSGVEEELHTLLEQTVRRQQEKGFNVKVGKTAWTQKEAKSAPAEVRARELMDMLNDSGVDAIIPPWGGELLIEILEHLDFEQIDPKWILGYSDTSLLLLSVTLNTGIATAHGTNIIDLRGPETDGTTAKWIDVLSTESGEEVTQTSSESYQRSWNHENPSPKVFHLTEKTEWKTASGNAVKFEGRLLGGCIDVIHHLAGTPFGNVKEFRQQHIPGEPVIWYLENCEMSVADLKRSLTQMKYAGWFENCAGVLFGRSAANHPTEGYTAEKMYKDLEYELGIPVIYDVDCGHMPPQIIFVNGAFAEVETCEGKGRVNQKFI